MKLNHNPILDVGYLTFTLTNRYGELEPRTVNFVIRGNAEDFLKTLTNAVEAANANNARSVEFLVVAVAPGADFDFAEGYVFKSQGEAAKALRVTPPAVGSARRSAVTKADSGAADNCEFTVRGVRLLCMDDCPD